MDKQQIATEILTNIIAINDSGIMDSIITHLHQNEENLFFHLVPNDCGCSNSPMQKQFKSPQTFTVSYLIDSYLRVAHEN